MLYWLSIRIFELRDILILNYDVSLVKYFEGRVVDKKIYICGSGARLL